MIQLSDMFNMIGVDGCSDVATSLGMQGTNGEVSIPIYEIFYVKILSAQHTQFLSSSIQEANALRELSVCCGGVCCAINLCDMDLLTLLGALCIYTPSQGMAVFVKNNIPDILNLGEDVIDTVLHMAGVPFEPGGQCIELVEKAVDILFDRLIDTLEDNLSRCGIALLDWSQLPEFYNTLRESGEMAEMKRFRAMTNAHII